MLWRYLGVVHLRRVLGDRYGCFDSAVQLFWAIYAMLWAIRMMFGGTRTDVLIHPYRCLGRSLRCFDRGVQMFWSGCTDVLIDLIPCFDQGMRMF